VEGRAKFYGSSGAFTLAGQKIISQEGVKNIGMVGV
jgi:hypothetical protein